VKVSYLVQTGAAATVATALMVMPASANSNNHEGDYGNKNLKVSFQASYEKSPYNFIKFDEHKDDHKVTTPESKKDCKPAEKPKQPEVKKPEVKRPEIKHEDKKDDHKGHDHDKNDKHDCKPTPKPTPTPTPGGQGSGPVVTPTPAPVVTPAVLGTQAAVQAQPAELPKTGAATGLLALATSGLAGIGAGVYRWRKQRA
jgi:LPXTG-motif cell wall-anchored protein